MNELVFDIEKDGAWLVASCHHPEISTQAESVDKLVPMIRDLVRCQFDSYDERLRFPIRLHFVDDPVLMPAE